MKRRSEKECYSGMAADNTLQYTKSDSAVLNVVESMEASPGVFCCGIS